MAATDAQPFPIKNKAYRGYAPVYTSAGALVTTGTMNVTRSLDGGTFAAATTATATQVATTSGVWYFELTSTEMNTDCTIVKISDGTNPVTVLTLFPVEIKELSGVPGFADGTTGLEELLSWLLATSRNKMTQTASTTTLFKDDGSTTLASSTITDNGTTLTRGELA